MIPFHIFAYEGELEGCSKSEEKLSNLQHHFTEIRHRLEEDNRSGYISDYDKYALLQLSKKVIESIARNYQNVVERISDSMGGTVLDYEVKDILMRGYNQAKEEDEKIIADSKAELADSKAKLADSKAKLADSKAKLADSKAKLADKDAELERLRSLLYANGIDFS